VASLGREKRILERLVTEGREIAQSLEDAVELMQPGVEEPSLLQEVDVDLDAGDGEGVLNVNSRRWPRQKWPG